MQTNTPIPLSYESPEQLLKTLSERLGTSKITERILNPDEIDVVDDNRELWRITPIIYAINNATKNWVLGVFASHVKDISSTRSYWQEIEAILAELWIKKEDIDRIQIKKESS